MTIDKDQVIKIVIYCLLIVGGPFIYTITGFLRGWDTKKNFLNSMKENKLLFISLLGLIAAIVLIVLAYMVEVI